MLKPSSESGAAHGGGVVRRRKSLALVPQSLMLAVQRAGGDPAAITDVGDSSVLEVGRVVGR